MKKLWIAILIVALTGSAVPAYADGYTPSHSCRKPYKPYQFDDDWEIEQFKDEVATYKRCINDFVEEQNEEAQNHQDAAGEAIEEWNRYVRYELN